jgi:hypothetical protein
VPPERIGAAIDRLREAGRPASQRELAGAVAKLIEFCRMMGAPFPTRRGESEEDAVARVSAFYVETLGDLPGWALAEAVAEVRKTRTWRNLPAPGDIREVVAAKVSAVRRNLGRHELALQRAKQWAPGVVLSADAISAKKDLVKSIINQSTKIAVD